jgi:hypothetical protein
MEFTPKKLSRYIGKPKLDEPVVERSINMEECKAIVAELKAKGRIWFDSPLHPSIKRHLEHNKPK